MDLLVELSKRKYMFTSSDFESLESRANVEEKLRSILNKKIKKLCDKAKSKTSMITKTRYYVLSSVSETTSISIDHVNVSLYLIAKLIKGIRDHKWWSPDILCEISHMGDELPLDHIKNDIKKLLDTRHDQYLKLFYLCCFSIGRIWGKEKIKLRRGFNVSYFLDLIVIRLICLMSFFPS